MNLKYFLRGLGVGIVFTIVIFNIFGEKAEKEVLTDEEIIERAEQLGMVMENKEIEESLNQILNNQEDVEQKDLEENPVEKNEMKQNEAVQNKNKQNEAEDNKAKQGEQDEQESSLLDSIEQEKRTIISSITITPGMDSTQIAKALEQVGVIENAEEFNDYLCETGNSVKLRIGTYQIEGTPSYEEIVKIITKK